MQTERIKEKLSILADAAKYDASCASSGAKRKNPHADGIGNAQGMGICHSYAPDGRCISLLKILLTNHCIYDCAYCINRSSSPTKRAGFTVAEVVWLTMEFYKRNYIEGLFLSSGIVSSPDQTMDQLNEVARRLRVEEKFGGYIHLKGVAGCSDELLAKAAIHADRVSANVELPSQKSLDTFAPGKKLTDVWSAFKSLKSSIGSKKEKTYKKRSPNLRIVGQSTQLVVGPGGHDDWDILSLTNDSYKKYGLSRVYYSAYSPIQEPDGRLPIASPDLRREHRLYQSDWLLRFYGFGLSEIVKPGQNLRLDIDPKLAWAFANPSWFPVDVNRATLEELLRVPGIGHKSASKLIEARRFRKLGPSHLRQLGVRWRTARAFVETSEKSASAQTIDALRAELEPRPGKVFQPSLFGD